MPRHQKARIVLGQICLLRRMSNKLDILICQVYHTFVHSRIDMRITERRTSMNAMQKVAWTELIVAAAAAATVALLYP